MFRNLIIFVAVFILTIFGIEYCMEPFGQFLFVNPIEIVGSLAFSIAYVTGIAPKICIFIAVAFISIVPVIVVIIVNRIFKKKKKRMF